MPNSAPLRDSVATRMKEAMKGGDKVRVGALRLIMAALKDREIEARGAGKIVSQADELALLTKMMDENSKLPEPLDARDVMMEAMVVSALDNAAAAERYGLRRDQIILSAKVSGVRDLIDVYTDRKSVV